MKRWGNFSLGVRLGIGQAVAVFVVMSVFTAAISITTSRIASKEAERILAQQAQALVDSISSFHLALRDSTEKLAAVFRAEFPGPISVDPAKTLPVGDLQTPQLTSGSTVLNLNSDPVDRFTSLTQAVATIFVRSGDDFVRIATSVKKEDGSRAVGTPLDRSSEAYQKLVNGEEFIGKASLFGKDYMTKYLPVKDEQGKVIAALFVGLDFTEALKALKNNAKTVVIGKTGYLFAIDARAGKEQGKLTIHPAKEGANVIDMADSNGRKFIREMVQRKNGIIRYPWQNKEVGDASPRQKVTAFRYVPQWDWVVGAGSYLDEFDTVGRTVRNTIAAATVVVVLLLVSLLAVLIRLWVTRPVGELLQQTERFASGDFSCVSEPSGEAGSSADEVQLLLQGVHRMASSLRGILGKVLASAREVGGAAALVSVAAQRIATGADEIAGKTITVATAGEEMSATSGDIAKSCVSVAEEAQRATRSAKNGTVVVEKTVSAMGRIAGTVRETARSVENLGARSDQIGEIIGAIEDIADQTNLLALNAAIEAARAGEQGRGFAVVADEVRALAERTTKATHEISKMIKTIQGEIKGAVAAMEEGVQQVETGTAEAAKSGEALQNILDEVDVVTVQVSQIAAAAEEQTATTCEIANSIHQVTDVVRKTASGAHESATAAAQMNANALELQRLVGQFRLE